MPVFASPNSIAAACQMACVSFRIHLSSRESHFHMTISPPSHSLRRCNNLTWATKTSLASAAFAFTSTQPTSFHLLIILLAHTTCSPIPQRSTHTHRPPAMPMDWNPATEAKLISAIFQVCDIKITSAEYAQLAKIMGPECTPKAVTHRVTKFKLGGGEDSGVEMQKKKSTKKKGKAAAKEEEEETPKVNASKKRTSQGKMKNDAGEVLLDEKDIEFGEDVGEGFRKKRIVEAVAEEDDDDDDGLL
ncbi:hypothetical protein AC579_5853 [Pseudocercospora musae]|uniref:Uncharacterized protein n=1 Tax=Pseudocercospora musae TaxID=113226 RepID=A0A139IM45_9PEZI|nr:hypothetical protein AC579_5853 [Pseudocercospora musae]